MFRPAPLCWFLLSLAGSVMAATPTRPVRGLPFVRNYPFEDVGSVSRGARLGFDPFGRVTAAQDGAYTVLNDTTWIDIADRTDGSVNMTNVVPGADGRSYYSSSGSWGVAEIDPSGKMHPRSLVPKNPPKWSATNNFSDIIATKQGMYFGGRDGVVFFDFRTQDHVFFAASPISRLFAVGDRAYISIHQGRIHLVDTATASLQPIPGTDLGGAAVDQAVRFGADEALLTTRDGHMLVFDGTSVSPWDGQMKAGFEGRVAALELLPEGDVAVALNGKGLFVVSRDGELKRSLISPELQSITGLAAKESGVLWAATDTGIEKILYNSPLSRFGQPLGLPVSWPQVARWGGRIAVASGGRLYAESTDANPGMTHFERVGDQPAAGVWTLATSGDRLLVGNAQGVFAAGSDGRFTQVLAGIDVARLIAVEGEVCFAIGAAEIAALRWEDGSWREIAPRVPGVGYPPVAHGMKRAAWVELGANGVARISLRDGKIQTRVIDQFPWQNVSWVNVGVVGNTIVLSGPPGNRTFFDDVKEEFCEAPELAKTLASSPSWVARVRADRDGTLWASHEHGISNIPLSGGPRAPGRAGFDIIDDRAPFVQMLSDGDIWISTAYSLYHVDNRTTKETLAQIKPVLVSIVDGRKFTGPNSQSTQSPAAYRIPLGESDLQFRFFAGTYASYRSPRYEYRLNQQGDTWTSLGNGSLLNFSELHEGQYHLDVRVRDNRGPIGQTASYDFEILPPWYRTGYAFAGYVLAFGAVVYGLIYWSGQRSRARNLALEKLVSERTNELRLAMQKLAEETRNAATLAERDRLAAEIHDSIQQGLSGLMLQLDATLKLASLSSEVRSRLTVARNMVSFTRHEVQHAVWDMESPLLEGTDLESALRQITSLISPGTVRIQIQTTGQVVALSSTIQHHLLRIAQEAITNAVRHAAAAIIKINLHYESPRIGMTIADDGCGFDPNAVMANGLGHFGLRGLRGRAAKIGAEIEIISSPGHGTTLRVNAPTHEATLPASVSHAALHATR